MTENCNSAVKTADGTLSRIQADNRLGKQFVNGLCIDETGNVKNGSTTDYVAKPYVGNIGQTTNGIVSVNAGSAFQNKRLSQLSPYPMGRGCKWEVDEREVLNAIFYQIHHGCIWSDLLKDLPAWQTVYKYFRHWQRQKDYERLPEMSEAMSQGN